MKQLWNFYQLSFPEFDINVFEAILSIQRFLIWPLADTEKLSLKYLLVIAHAEMPIWIWHQLRELLKDSFFK